MALSHPALSLHAGGMWQLFLRTSCLFSDGYKLLLPLGEGRKEE